MNKILNKDRVAYSRLLNDKLCFPTTVNNLHLHSVSSPKSPVSAGLELL